ncbi:MAG: acyltransferase [Planctomycetota bacterium]|nr:acyltransferase [Planctomycetota bacterium]
MQPTKSTPPQGRESSRILELDAVRGLAAFAVVLYHYTTRYDHKVGHASAPLFEVPWGHYGVELFFLLSGFVIFMTLERTKRSSDFLISRLSRLYPGYWVGMACTLGAVAMLGSPFAGYDIGASDVALNTTMLQRYVPGTPNVDGVYWTLSVELTFYALVLGLFATGLLRRIRVALVALLAIELVLHFATSGGDAAAPLALRATRQVFLSHYGPYFAAGILFFKLRNEPETGRHFVDAGLILLCLAVAGIMRPGETLFASTICFVIFGLLTSGFLEKLANRPLLFLGGISYSLYVVHQVIGFLVIRTTTDLGLSTNGAILLAILVSVCLATAITYLVELPAQRWLRTNLRRWRDGRATQESGPLPSRVRDN